ncbi:MAG: tetratricopeptide repeat protein [Candidatus Scalindua sp.]|jgi:Ca-activated chloride channel family protein|nr:tetratricopeptide repeat protein [Candidatus Scalindua sp.]MDV5166877.1 tetratricopeptide repeat protein [Candidatus Scalindua sp.]
MKFRTKLRIFIIPLACTLLIGWIDPASDKNEEGILLYNEKSYDEAISKFADAQVHLPKSDALEFNIANTHFQGGKLPEAEKAYKNALRSKNSTLKAKANYNMGNTLYKQGKLNEALDYYKKTIELTGKIADKEDDEIKGIKEDAKYNYEFVQKKMEEMKQEQQERQDQEEQEKEDKEEEDKQEEQKQGDQPPEEQKPEDQEQKQDQQQQKEDKEKEDKGNQSGQQKEQPPEGEKKESPPRPQEKKEMTKEEAERILDALKQSEESARELQEKENESAQYETEKNW